MSSFSRYPTDRLVKTEAREKNVEGRPKMSKRQLERAVGRRSGEAG